MPEFFLKNHKFQSQEVQKEEQWLDIQTQGETISKNFNVDSGSSYPTWIRDIKNHHSNLKRLRDTYEISINNFSKLKENQKGLLDHFKININKSSQVFHSFGKLKAKTYVTNSNLDTINLNLFTINSELRTLSEKLNDQLKQKFDLTIIQSQYLEKIDDEWKEGAMLDYMKELDKQLKFIYPIS